jgi:septum formation protein
VSPTKSSSRIPGPRPVILASTSRYRRELLERLRIAFRCENPGVDEAALAGEAPRAQALRLALAKARAVADRQPQALVIGSDQVCCSGNEVLGKPGSAAANREQLRLLSGQTATFFTAVAIVSVEGGIWKQHVDETRCVLRVLNPDEIAGYVDAEQPFDCAGGFKSEGLGITLFERIETTDPTALIGLPLIWTASALRDAAVMPQY